MNIQRGSYPLCIESNPVLSQHSKLCCSVTVFIAWKARHWIKVSAVPLTQHGPLSMSPFLSLEQKKNQTTKHEFQPVHISEAFLFSYQEKKPYLRTNFSFIRCITGSKNSSPGHQSFTSFGPSRRIDLQPPTCPLPGSWWKDKAGIQTPITSSSPSPHAPLSCPPLATNPFLSVSARICLWEGSIADREQKRGNRSRWKKKLRKKGKRI